MKALTHSHWFALSLLPILGLSSCVGVGVTGPDRLSSTRFTLPHGAGQHLYVSERGSNPTRRDMLAEWGQPSEKRAAPGGGETWVWNRKTIWSGVYAMVTVVPIPLALPLSHEATEVRFGPGDAPALEWVDQQGGDGYVGIGLSPNMAGDDPQLGPFFSHDFSHDHTLPSESSYTPATTYQTTVKRAGHKG